MVEEENKLINFDVDKEKSKFLKKIENLEKKNSKYLKYIYVLSAVIVFDWILIFLF